MALQGKTIGVVLPAYNAAATLGKTYQEIPLDVVDFVLLVDDASQDETVQVARRLNLNFFVHESNRGYGANQKTCYREGLKLGADVLVMLHADYQYTPRLIPAMVSMLVSGHYDLVLGSRILGGRALQGGMPLYKYVSNRFLTCFENLLSMAKLSEYHSGYRAFTREVLESLPLEENSDDFLFDNQILLQALYFGFRIGEISCPTKYFPEASSINFQAGARYGLGVLQTAVKFRLQKLGLARFPIFDPRGKRLQESENGGLK
ncbi:MAG: glycosyltransferase family 2 protein [Acidobacteriota bacterium]